MSEIADRVRTQRQHWAAPGSRHDRFVTLARWLLPSAIGVLTAFLVMAPIYSSSEVSFVLDKKKVEVAKERMKIQAAQYRGVDDKGQPFSLDAGSAIQRSSAEPVVQLNKLSAAIRLSDGPATVSANSGRYDMSTEQVQLDGPLDFRSAGGYDLRTHDATIDLQQRTLVSGGAVTGQVPQGHFSANKMRADLENRTVRLEGNARLRIVP
ncbi:LPS export ABC transporter periplasmic protein LptC [Sphingomonas sp. Sph1(2015)]|jgi:lipopolysaccharide export system protein LptC|uniref:LPS export ABC transporter periplasmic protein LptC n=1 Tax=Sphingomonas TaxID=13687 RepID=UPI000975F7F1|nr:LPS export ABC transporter periplasmic protein LptC [Sphingomonas sp. Sph1(2015)]OMJ31848.1 LPS export ABC transporter periplasmic protein LptC [Sphingomonas sp. Sph1(2015)]